MGLCLLATGAAQSDQYNPCCCVRSQKKATSTQQLFVLFKTSKRQQISHTTMMEPKRASLNVPAPITIHEDDAVKFKKCNRSISMPELFLFKSIMRCKTLDDSLHSTYGSQSDTFSGHGGKSIKFDKIVIREYSRTVGDNPSCSCGPPVR